MQATRNKPPLIIRALSLLGLSKYQVQVLEAIGILGQVLKGAPRLAGALLAVLPDIQSLIVRFEGEIPGTGRGTDRATAVVGWLLKHRANLQTLASVGEISVAVRAILTIIVGSLNESGMLQKQTE